MEKRKFRLSVHRKKEKWKRQQKKTEETTARSALSLVVSIPRYQVTISDFEISIPVSAYRDGPVISVDQLCSRLTSLSLPKSWVISSTKPLILSKVRVNTLTMNSDILFIISIDAGMKWSLFLQQTLLDSRRCPLLRKVPTLTLNSVGTVHQLLSIVDASKICRGNPEKKFLDQWQQRSITLHGSSGETIVYR